MTKCLHSRQALLTVRRRLLETGLETFFQTIGIEPSFNVRRWPLKWTDLSKQSREKCSEHTGKVPEGLKLALWVRTNLTQRALWRLFDGLRCNEIPASATARLPQSCTTQREEGMKMESIYFIFDELVLLPVVDDVLREWRHGTRPNLCSN